VLAVVGAVAGLVLAVLPVALFAAYVDIFVETAAPDSGFNVYTLGSLASALFAVVLFVAAIPLAVVRSTRPVGVGYLVGFACGVGLDVLAAILVLG
jgi:hypothetical protein